MGGFGLWLLAFPFVRCAILQELASLQLTTGLMGARAFLTKMPMKLGRFTEWHWSRWLRSDSSEPRDKACALSFFQWQPRWHFVCRARHPDLAASDSSVCSKD